jgi:hypothetical protein
MTGVLRSFRRPRSRLILLAAFLAVMGQAVTTLIAPVAEAHASRSAPAHVEADGTQQHYSHNPTDCAACLALQLTGLPQHVAPSPPVRAVRFTSRPAESRRTVAPSWFDPNNSRAPPALPAPVR